MSFLCCSPRAGYSFAGRNRVAFRLGLRRRVSHRLNYRPLVCRQVSRRVAIGRGPSVLFVVSFDVGHSVVSYLGGDLVFSVIWGPYCKYEGFLVSLAWLGLRIVGGLMTTVAIISLFVAVAGAAETFLVTKTGVFKRVFSFPPGSKVIGVGDTPDDPGDPDPSDVVESVRIATGAWLKDIEAGAIAAIAKQTIGERDQKATFAAAMLQLKALNVFPGAKIDDFVAALEVASGGTWDDDFLGDVVDGMQLAYPATAAARAAAFGDGTFKVIFDIISCVIAKLPNNAQLSEDDQRAVNFLLIFKIIGCVMDNLPANFADMSPAEVQKFIEQLDIPEIAGKIGKPTLASLDPELFKVGWMPMNGELRTPERQRALEMLRRPIRSVMKR